MRKWQPIMAVLEDQRLECVDCHALATFLIFGKLNRDEDGDIYFYCDAYCQDCFIPSHDDASQEQEEAGQS